MIMFQISSYSIFFLLFHYLGMSELVKERPNNPIEYLANYLIRHDPQRVGAPPPPAAMGQQMPYNK